MTTAIQGATQRLVLVLALFAYASAAQGQAVAPVNSDTPSLYESIASDRPPTRSAIEPPDPPGRRPSPEMPLLGDEAIRSAVHPAPGAQMVELGQERRADGLSYTPLESPVTAVAGPRLHVAPDQLVLSHARPQGSVRVYLGADPAPASILQGARLEAYGRMFVLAPSSSQPGQLDISLNLETAEYGSYRLLLHSGADTAFVDVRIVGPESPLGATAPAFYPRLNLEPSYPEGSVLNYTLDGPGDLEYAWSVNGDEVLRGRNARTLQTCLHQVGPLHVAVILKRKNQQISRAAGSSTVTPIDATPWEVPARALVTLDRQLPVGYRDYHWTLDGDPVAKTRVLNYQFDAPGRHRLDGYAAIPLAADEPRTHVHIAYDVRVVPAIPAYR